MAPNARRRHDGEFFPGISPDCRFLVGPDGEVTDRAWGGLGGEIGNRFRRYIWQPYRWYLLVLVLASGLIGCAVAGGAASSDNPSASGTTAAWGLVGFGGGVVVGGVILWLLTVLLGCWLCFWAILDRKQKLAALTIIGAILLAVHFWW